MNNGRECRVKAGETKWRRALNDKVMSLNLILSATKRSCTTHILADLTIMRFPYPLEKPPLPLVVSGNFPSWLPLLSVPSPWMWADDVCHSTLGPRCVCVKPPCCQGAWVPRSHQQPGPQKSKCHSHSVWLTVIGPQSVTHASTQVCLMTTLGFLLPALLSLQKTQISRMDIRMFSLKPNLGPRAPPFQSALFPSGHLPTSFFNHPSWHRLGYHFWQFWFSKRKPLECLLDTLENETVKENK